jgi:hypothetical protein
VAKGVNIEMAPLDEDHVRAKIASSFNSASECGNDLGQGNKFAHG